MLELVITYKYPDGNTFYIYRDDTCKRAYLTTSKCYLCDRPHELVDLLVTSPNPKPSYDVVYECPTTHAIAELIAVTSK